MTMRRVTQSELDFYDAVALRINRCLGDPACTLTQGSLASRIGWHRASLCNFLNRIDKTIAAHFLPRIAQTFRVSVEELMGGVARGEPERTSWDPRSDDAETLVEKLGQWRERNLPNVRLHGHLPAFLLPRRGMVAGYVDSVFESGSPEAAERWHDVIDAQAKMIAEQGEGDVVHLIFFSDLLRLPDREYPFESFTRDEVIYMLETLKKTWIRQRGFCLIALDDSALTAEVKLELASNASIGVVGRELRIECGNDFRVRWSADAQAVSATNELLLGLRKSAGFGARERPTTQQVEQLIDGLLRRLDQDRAAVRIPQLSAA
jgi:hypothetical protein